jgi:hypothetical protein
MQSLTSDCQISIHSRTALENVASSDWRSTGFSSLSVGRSERTAHSDTIRVTSENRGFEIGAVFRYIAPKWEVFVLHAEELKAGGECDKASLHRAGHYTSANEMLEAFLGRNHTLFLGLATGVELTK